MNKNPQKQRMNIQLNQIRSILNDFRKTKNKCIDLAKLINIQMPKQEHFKTIEKATLRKMDLLDITGLVNLKNELVRGLTQLFEIERQLRYQRQKFDARKQIMEADRQEQEYLKRNQVSSAIQSPRNNKPIFQTNVRSIMIQPKIQEPSFEPSRPKNKNLQIPLYRAKNETNDNKLDRISKYVASLKRNMKLNSQTLGYKWKIKQFLLEDPNYLKLRNQVEMFMMRQEELDHIFSKAVEKGVRQYIKKAQIVQSNQQYKLIKVYKQNLSKKTPQKSLNNQNSLLNDSKLPQSRDITSTSIYQSPKARHQSFEGAQIEQNTSSFLSPKTNKQISSIVSPSKISINSPLRNLSTKIQIQEKAEQDFKSIKKELEKSNESYIEMMSKINQTVQKGSEKLIMMREKRKKKFEKDDDIWDELDKI